MNETIQYKIAETEEEKIQIYELNYRTFVEEIPQHTSNEEKILIDKFDNENEYIIAINPENRVIGMVCIRDQRPFSLDLKINNLDEYFSPSNKLCEIRLLAVLPEYRKSGVFGGLAKKLFEYASPRGYDKAIISGTDRQLELYKHLGFIVFAPPVGTEQALFYPMYLDIEKLRNNPLFS